ncbi:MAG: NAD(P)H-dependent oxidoreductase [Anaerolineae bacterium]|nr:NAD(P)H-dependent oxidoreductase [Anaerolineae bacterium]
MRVMITIDHPWKESFNHAIMAQIVTTLEQGDHSVDVLDLHDEDFDPVLRVHELADYGKGKVHDPKVLDYQARVMQADHLIYIFPVWWEVMPALLKGFFDKVFTPTFAFNEADFSPCLGHVKTGTAITTMGAPKPIHTSVEPVLCKGILEATGVQQTCWINLADMPNTTLESRTAWVERILAHVRGLA